MGTKSPNSGSRVVLESSLARGQKKNLWACIVAQTWSDSSGGETMQRDVRLPPALSLSAQLALQDRESALSAAASTL